MTARVSLTFGAATFVLGRLMWPWIRGRWDELAEQAETALTRDQPDRVLIGIGPLRDHIVVRLLSFEAICGQSVSSVHAGELADANCRACRRQLARAERRVRGLVDPEATS